MAWSDASVTRIALDGTVKHEGGQQFLAGKGFAGEKFPRAHRVEPHGFTSHPVAGGIGTLVQSRTNRDSVYVLGGANPGLVPQLGMGGAAIYDHLGNIVSVVNKKIRIVAADEVKVETKVAIVQVSEKAVVEGPLVYLGGEPGAAQVLTTSGPSTKVFAQIA